MQHTISFHNTLPLTDEEQIKQADRKAMHQDQEILDFMTTHHTESFTPAEIWMNLGMKWPITSVRRAVTNLTKEGWIEMTGHMKMGLYGTLNNTWKRTNKQK